MTDHNDVFDSDNDNVRRVCKHCAHYCSHDGNKCATNITPAPFFTAYSPP